MTRAFSLSPVEEACFLQLLKVDHEAPESTEARRSREQLRLLRRVLANFASVDVEPRSEEFLAMDCIAAFALFRGRPTEADLVGYFKERPAQAVSRAVEYLVASGAARREGDVLVEERSGLVFRSGEGNQRFVGYWKDSLDEARNLVERWAPRSSDSCFTSLVVSVERERYRELLDQFKKQILEFVTACDAENPENLVRVNVQAYPLKEWD